MLNHSSNQNHTVKKCQSHEQAESRSAEINGTQSPQETSAGWHTPQSRKETEFTSDDLLRERSKSKSESVAKHPRVGVVLVQCLCRHRPCAIWCTIKTVIEAHDEGVESMLLVTAHDPGRQCGGCLLANCTMGN